VKDPFLDYMVKAGVDPRFVREQYDFPPDFSIIDEVRDETAIWSFSRHGHSTTHYRNKFRIHIGGVYWDIAAPDFLIYNDVIVQDWTGRVWIYFYPSDVFPPTGYHTATLLDEEFGPLDSVTNGIITVGGSGYSNDRSFWETPVHHLDLNEMGIRTIDTTGDAPGWILDHSTTLVDKTKLLVTGGKILDEHDNFNSNPNRFELDLWTRKWTKYA